MVLRIKKWSMHAKKHLCARLFFLPLVLCTHPCTHAKLPDANAQAAQKQIKNGLEDNLYMLLAAEFLLERQNRSAATSLYEQQAYQSSSVDILKRALTLTLEDDTHDNAPKRALDLAHAWSSNNPAHVPAWFFEAHLALKAGHYEQAAQILNKILQYEADADLEQILTGISPESPEAQNKLLKALKSVKSTNPTLLALKASLYFSRQEYEQALTVANAALKSKPNAASLIVLKAKILAQIDIKRSANFIALQRSKFPNSKPIVLYEIRQLLQQNQAETAFWRLLDATKRFNQDNEVKLLASLVAIDTEHYTQAKKLLSSLVNDFSYTEQAHYYLGITLEREGDLEAAAKHFARVIKQDDIAWEAQRKLALIRLSQNQPDNALTGLRAFASANMRFFTPAKQLEAKILSQIGHTHKAKSVLRLAAKQPNLTQTDANALLHAYTRLLNPKNKNELAEKLDILERLVDGNQNSAIYKWSLARALEQSGTQTKRAIILLEEVLTTAPKAGRAVNHRQAHRLLAKLYLKAGYTAKSADMLLSSYHAKPNQQDGMLLLQALKSTNDSELIKKILRIKADMQKRFGTLLNRSNQ